MRKIRQVLKLARESGLTKRQIARSLAMSPTTVGEYLRRADDARLVWPLPPDWDDRQLESALFPSLPRGHRDTRPPPDWPTIHCDYKRKGVTLLLLWEEYKAASPDGIQYSQFCDRYRAWTGKLNLVMRQHHRAGEKLFVDYSGQTVAVVDQNVASLRGRSHIPLAHSPRPVDAGLRPEGADSDIRSARAHNGAI